MDILDLATWLLFHPWTSFVATLVLGSATYLIRKPARKMTGLIPAWLIATASVLSLALWHVGHALGEEARLERLGLPLQNELLHWAQSNSLGMIVLPLRIALVVIGFLGLLLALWRRNWYAAISLPILAGALVVIGYTT